MGGLGAGVLLGAVVGCGVTRTEPVDTRQPSDLLTLRRAGEALTERIAEEEQHVAALRRQLDELRVAEERLNRDFLEAEEGFQTLQSDLDGTLAEVRSAERELSTSRERLATLRVEQATLLAERVTAEQDVDESRRESIAWLALRRDVVNELRRWRDRLEPYRARWGVDEVEWEAFLRELGLWARAAAAGRTGAALGRVPGSVDDEAGAPPSTGTVGEAASGGDG